jgi:acyl-CoA reductase-like NAD-dependent aldehyde dehydrogenase
MAASKIGHALYTGNTVVLKPSPYTPLSTLLLGEVARETLPAGVLNVLAGGNELGRWMTEHPRIAKISFTGSVATGKRVIANAAGTLKRVTLELGGN